MRRADRLLNFRWPLRPVSHANAFIGAMWAGTSSADRDAAERLIAPKAAPVLALVLSLHGAASISFL